MSLNLNAHNLSISTSWNVFCSVLKCFFTPRYVESFQSNPLAWNNLSAVVEKDPHASRLGLTLAYVLLSLTSAARHYFASHHFSCLLSIPLSSPLAGYFSPPNKWRNAAAYFLNLLQGQESQHATVWLTRKRAGMAQMFAVCLRVSLSAAQTRSPVQTWKTEE